MIFENYDRGMKYFIPKNKCRIDEFSVNGNRLTLSTGESVVFRSQESAETLWWLFEACFRKGWSRLQFQESAGLSFSMYRE